MGRNLLSDFCGSVQARMQRFGFDWSTLLVTLLPVVIEMISNCFNKSSDLAAFASGQRSPLQLAGLRRKCKEVVKEQGVRGIFRVSAAASDLQDAILAELAERANMAAGPNLWQQAMDEALSV